jgi:ribose transport system permease protein
VPLIPQTAEASAAGAVAAPPGARRLRVSALRDYGIVLVFIALFIALAVSSDVFLTKTNLLNILDQWSAVGIMACGATLVLVAGGFDLSVGAIYALSGVIAAKVAISTGVAVGLIAGVAVGLVAGLLNGMLSTSGRVNPFIATLASGIMIRGLAVVISGGFLLSVSDKGFSQLGRGELIGVKWSVWAFLVVVLLTGFLLHRSVLGRYVFAAGGNMEAARLSGVRVNLVRTITYVISGVTASLAGVIVASRVATGQADGGVGIEFDVIAAVVIGGTSILGGAGAIWRSVLGVLLIAMLGNGFNLLGVDATYQDIIFGGIIILAVGLDAWARKSH